MSALSKPPVISLYSGCGGLDMGLEAAGFDIRVAVEMDRHCCETLRQYRPKMAVLEGPIDDFSSRQILRAAGLKKGEAALVVGGPPCQPFSKAGYWTQGDTKRLDDPRAGTLTSFMRVVRDTQPGAFLLENVKGLEYSKKNEGLVYLMSLLNEINASTKASYSVQWQVLNAISFGVPQRRERGFLIGARDGTPFRFPEPRFGDPEAQEGGLFGEIEPYRTAWDAIGDLAAPQDEDLEVKGRWAALLPTIPEGQNYLWHTDRRGGEPLFGWRTKYWSFLLKLAKCQPSWTVAAQPGPSIGPFHWDSRRLSMRELSRIQTFPDDLHIVGPRVEVQRQAGNAVPSLLTEVLGREIQMQFFGKRYRSKELRLLPPDRSPPPDPIVPAPVPEEFMALKGDHAPHPGTGKGPVALRRHAGELV